MAEGVSVFVFFGAEDVLRANAINHELDMFMHGVDGRNGECDKLGDLGEVRNCVCGLVGVFEEVGDPCIEEREFMGVLGIGGVFLVGTW